MEKSLKDFQNELYVESILKKNFGGFLDEIHETIHDIISLKHHVAISELSRLRYLSK